MKPEQDGWPSVIADGRRIGYTRASSPDDLSQQADALLGFQCVAVFHDDADSFKAPLNGLADAISHIRAGDALVVTSIDRIGRSLAHLVMVVVELKQRGAGLISLGDAGIDTTATGEAATLRVFDALAAFESALIRERTAIALNARRVKGITGGRHRTVTPELLAQAREHIESGRMPIRKVAEMLGVSKSSIHRALAANKSSET